MSFEFRDTPIAAALDHGATSLRRRCFIVPKRVIQREVDVKECLWLWLWREKRRVVIIVQRVDRLRATSTDKR